MPKRPSSLPLPLPPRPPGPGAVAWLVGAVREAVLDGRLRSGARLPSTRDLARAHGVSRSTVVEAYERLQSEGYAEGRPGAGTFVRANLGDGPPLPGPPGGPAAPVRPARRLSAYAGRVRPLHVRDPAGPQAFRVNRPDPALFPHDVWRRLTGRRLRGEGRLLPDLGPLGYGPLREAVAEYARSSRGARCEAGQVAITSGASGALDLLGRVLLDPGDRVGVEDPGYPGATVRFRALGADVVPLPVDDQGCRVPTEDGLRAVFVTPGHQFPTGVTMGLPRRLALLDWARASGALVLEDDYDSEFWYGGRPLPVLQGLDRHGTVALVGSFSKTVGPAIRLGFVVLPPDLVDPFARAAWVPGGPGSAVDQTVLADFLAGGHYSRHLRRTRETYAGRLAVLQEEVGRRLGGALSLSGVEAGLQTVGWLAPGLDAEAVTGRAAALGVLVVPVSRYAARPLVRDGLRLGFASVGEGQIRWGVEQLARAVDGLPGAP
ncbi:MAG TPA: PLP-dependent aminotransferase family protein [Rubricoccaceae bacterium]